MNSGGKMQVWLAAALSCQGLRPVSSAARDGAHLALGV